MFNDLEVAVESTAVVAVVVESLAQIGNVCLIALCLGQLVEQVPHVLVKVLLKLVNHVWVVILQNVPLDHGCFLGTA